MIGELGVAKTDVGDDGTVLVAGELWRASAEESTQIIAPGQRVQVIGIDGLHLTVRPAEAAV